MISAATPLVLGSGSPRRRELLASIGIPHVVRSPTVDERRRGLEAPHDYLQRVVEAKLVATLASLDERGCPGVLVADTIVVLDGDVLGKPLNAADAVATLARLSGTEHEVMTRFALAEPQRACEHAETVVTRVRFRSLTGGEIDRYVATGEGADKAGAYAIQGVGAFAVESISGSYANVVGLPLCEVVVALVRLGMLGAFP